MAGEGCGHATGLRQATEPLWSARVRPEPAGRGLGQPCMIRRPGWLSADPRCGQRAAEQRAGPARRCPRWGRPLTASRPQVRQAVMRVVGGWLGLSLWTATLFHKPGPTPAEQPPRRDPRGCVSDDVAAAPGAPGHPRPSQARLSLCCHFRGGGFSSGPEPSAAALLPAEQPRGFDWGRFAPSALARLTDRN